LYDQFDITKPLTDTANANALKNPRNIRVPTMLCPTDSGSDVPFAGDNVSKYPWARGNYAANGANGALYTDISGHASWYPVHCGVSGQSAANAPGWVDLSRRGVMGAGVAVRMKEITDGISKTMLISEVRIGLADVDRRGTWALGAPGASAL